MKYKVIKTDREKNREDIINLWKRNLPDNPEDRYAWIYENNPHGMTSCWLGKETDRDEVVGATAIFPRKILINGESKLAGIAGDLAVDKAHRSFGPALLLQKAAISDFHSDTLDLIYGISNKQAKPIQLRTGYKKVGDVIWMAKILKSNSYLSRYIKYPLLLKLFSKIINLLLRLISKETYKVNSEKFYYENLKMFDKRFHDLWKKVSQRHTIITERNDNLLNWRYSQNPHNAYNIFGMSRDTNGDIIGYIVYRITENTIKIVDIMAIDNDEVFNNLMSEFITRKKKLELIL
jgi:hypothetical protein